MATSIDQGQRPAGAQCTQVRQSQAANTQAAGRIRRDHGLRQSRNGGQVVDHSRLAGRQQGLPLDLNQRRRRIDGVATDTRTGDDDLFDHGCILRRRLSGLGEGRSRHSKDAGEDGRPE
ncbi:hypothetical protein D3C80_1291630 [compost metagenome]